MDILQKEQEQDNACAIVAQNAINKAEVGKMHTLFLPDYERYPFDMLHCTVGQGFAQVDTTQDAPYFGTWANPFLFITVSYCEGDVSIGRYKSADEFAVEMRRIRDVYNENGSDGFKGIDPGWGGKGSKELRARFIEIGLSDLLH